MTGPVEIIRVALRERAYDIHIGSGVLPSAAAFIDAWAHPRHVVVVTDENVEQPHAAAVAESLGQRGTSVDVLVIESGEESKSIEVAADLWEQMLGLGADRSSVVVVVGGGVVGDLAGFVAATVARGLKLVQVPTTLLAQVDSSVGGKVGINLPSAKNMVGCFWQPAGVLVDTDVLATLPDRDYRAGLAEVVKYGVILDADFFAQLESNVERLNRRDSDVLRQVVARCCRIKADVVEQDEREETGLRAVLNYGHTFGHALEAVAGYGTLLHGEAVAIGMICASRLAERLGRIDGEMTARQERLLSALHLPTQLPAVDRKSIISAMAHDKKVNQGRLRFVLPTELGHVELVSDVDLKLVEAALDA
jgi:3-dehydroquinate synthase